MGRLRWLYVCISRVEQLGGMFFLDEINVYKKESL